MNTIYIPKGKAKEYGDYALNIYQGCPHGCIYCFAPSVLKRDRGQFHDKCDPRANIVSETNEWLKKHPEIKGKHIHLCFTCDPYPLGRDCSITDELIKLVHASGNYVQILTKGFMDNRHLLTENDIFGTTISCSGDIWKEVEPKTFPPGFRLAQLRFAKEETGCKTFVSCEPVFEADTIYQMIRVCDYIDEYKIGKLNYMAKDDPLYPKDINWGEFGRECERLCKEYGRNYYIKEGLRKEMEKK